MPVRVDGTAASGSWEVTEDGLFQCGHRKDHRPDQPQVQVMRATLDPLGMPVAVDVLPDQRTDDRRYLPIICRVRASLGTHGLLAVGDRKLCALGTRAHIHHDGDHYLCPLGRVQLPADQLVALVEAALAAPKLLPILRPTAKGVLEAFRDLTLTVVALPNQIVRHLTPLSALQRRLLALAGLEEACYTRLVGHLSKPPG